MTDGSDELSDELSNLVHAAEEWASETTTGQQPIDFDDPNSYPMWVPIKVVADQLARELCRIYHWDPETGADTRLLGGDSSDSVPPSWNIFKDTASFPAMETEGKSSSEASKIPPTTEVFEKNRQDTMFNTERTMATLSTIYEDSQTATPMHTSLNTSAKLGMSVRRCLSETYTLCNAEVDSDTSSDSSNSNELNRKIAILENTKQKPISTALEKEITVPIMDTISASAVIEHNQFPAKNSAANHSKIKSHADTQKKFEAPIMINTPPLQDNKGIFDAINGHPGNKNHTLHDSSTLVTRKAIVVAANDAKESKEKYPDKANETIRSYFPEIKDAILPADSWKMPRIPGNNDALLSGTPINVTNANEQTTEHRSPCLTKKEEYSTCIEASNTPVKKSQHGSLSEETRLLIDSVEEKLSPGFVTVRRGSSRTRESINRNPVVTAATSSTTVVKNLDRIAEDFGNPITAVPAKADNIVYSDPIVGLRGIFTVPHDNKNCADTSNERSSQHQLIAETTLSERRNSGKNIRSVMDSATQVTPKKENCGTKLGVEDKKNLKIRAKSYSTVLENTSCGFQTEEDHRSEYKSEATQMDRASEVEHVDLCRCFGRCRARSLGDTEITRDTVSSTIETAGNSEQIRGTLTEPLQYFNYSAKSRTPSLTPRISNLSVHSMPPYIPRRKTVREIIEEGTRRKSYYSATITSSKKQCAKSSKLTEPINPPKHPGELPLGNRAYRLKFEHVTKKKSNDEKKKAAKRRRHLSAVRKKMHPPASRNASTDSGNRTDRSNIKPIAGTSGRRCARRAADDARVRK